VAVPPVVEASPARVAAHDRAGWLALFSASAVLEDPVGAAEHRGAQLASFYDTFIAPNRIRFEVAQDAIAEGEVVRDVTIHTRLSTGVDLSVPAYVRYRLSADGTRLEALAAYWEVRRMVCQVVRAGLRGLWTMTILALRMLRRQGPRGIWGFLRGLSRGVFDGGHRAVERLVDALNRGDGEAVAGSFAHGACIEWPAGRVVDSLSEQFEGELTVGKAISAGWSTACRFEVVGGERGVAVFVFVPGTGRIESARFYATARTE